jgi:hypothetical protein
MQPVIIDSTPGEPPGIEYPITDDEPVGVASLQFRWMVTLYSHIDFLFADRADVVVHADNFVYPVEGRPDVRVAPDVYVAFGRPKQDHGNYKVWEEGGVFPQVVIELRGPDDTDADMYRKHRDYDRFGAEEYYMCDPERVALEVYRREAAGLVAVPFAGRYTSPLMGVTFDMTGDELAVFDSDGERFLTVEEQSELLAAARRHADAKRRRADALKEWAAARQRVERYSARLRALGIDPDAE